MPSPRKKRLKKQLRQFTSRHQAVRDRMISSLKAHLGVLDHDLTASSNELSGALEALSGNPLVVADTLVGGVTSKDAIDNKLANRPAGSENKYLTNLQKLFASHGVYGVPKNPNLPSASCQAFTLGEETLLPDSADGANIFSWKRNGVTSGETTAIATFGVGGKTEGRGVANRGPTVYQMLADADGVSMHKKAVHAGITSSAGDVPHYQMGMGEFGPVTGTHANTLGGFTVISHSSADYKWGAECPYVITSSATRGILYGPSGPYARYVPKYNPYRIYRFVLSGSAPEYDGIVNKQSASVSHLEYSSEAAFGPHGGAERDGGFSKIKSIAIFISGALSGSSAMIGDTALGVGGSGGGFDAGGGAMYDALCIYTGSAAFHNKSADDHYGAREAADGWASADATVHYTGAFTGSDGHLALLIPTGCLRTGLHIVFTCSMVSAQASTVEPDAYATGSYPGFALWWTGSRAEARVRKKTTVLQGATDASKEGSTHGVYDGS